MPEATTSVGTARISSAIYDRTCRLAVDYQTSCSTDGDCGSSGKCRTTDGHCFIGDCGDSSASDFHTANGYSVATSGRRLLRNETSSTNDQ